MAAQRYLTDGEEGLRKLIHSVLDSNSESSNFSKDETEPEKGNSDNNNQSSAQSSDKNNETDDKPGPLKCIRIMLHKKQSNWKWEKTDNHPIIYEFNKNSGVLRNY
jgi:hypothetical protein